MTQHHPQARSRVGPMAAKALGVTGADAHAGGYAQDMSNHHSVFSLSSSPKVLSQWRAYASDEMERLIASRHAKTEAMSLLSG